MNGHIIIYNKVLFLKKGPIVLYWFMVLMNFQLKFGIGKINIFCFVLLALLCEYLNLPSKIINFVI